TREGPIDCQIAAVGTGGAARALVLTRRARVFRRRRPSAVAALTMVAAKDLARAGVRLTRLALRAPTTGAFKAARVNPNFGLAARGTATVATTSLLRTGSRLPRYANSRCSALPPGGEVLFFLPRRPVLMSILLLIAPSLPSSPRPWTACPSSAWEPLFWVGALPRTCEVARRPGRQEVPESCRPDISSCLSPSHRSLGAQLGWWRWTGIRWGRLGPCARDITWKTSRVMANEEATMGVTCTTLGVSGIPVKAPVAREAEAMRDVEGLRGHGRFSGANRQRPLPSGPRVGLVSGPSPELAGGEPRAFRHGRELQPHYARVIVVESDARGSKSTISTGDDVFATDDLRVAHDPLGDQLGILPALPRLTHNPPPDYPAVPS